MSDPIEDLIVSLASAAKPGKGISPEDVAKALEPEAWRRSLGHVKAVALGMARHGRLEILRHAKPVDPHAPVKGVYRLRLPQPTEKTEELP